MEVVFIGFSREFPFLSVKKKRFNLRKTGFFCRLLLLCQDILANIEAATKKANSVNDFVIISAHSSVLIFKGFYKKERGILHVNISSFYR